MTPTIAFEPVARWISRGADLAAVVALVSLAMEALFGGTHAFETWTLQAAALGALACFTDARATRRLPWALIVYVVVACLSSAVHEWSRLAPGVRWFHLFAPAFHVIVMTCLVFAASHTLRTPRRLALLIIALGGALVVIAVQIVFDRLVSGFVYDRMGSRSMPSVAQWGGLHQTGLLLVLGLTLTGSGVALGQSVVRILAGLVMCVMFLVAAYFNGSRSGILVMAIVVAVMFLCALASRRRGRVTKLRVAAAVAACAGVAVLFVAIYAGKTAMPGVKSLTGDRSPIWRAAARIAIDHPILGAGPGRYTETMDSGYASRYLPWYPHNRGGLANAHNAVLHAAAEIGIIGAGALVAFWWWTLAACRRAWVGCTPLIGCTLFFALSGLFARLMFDSFLEGVVTADRTRVLAGLLFAAAVATDRLAGAPSSA